MDEIRVAVVGLGKIARDQHLPAIAGTDGVRLAAVVSRHASLPGIPSYPTLDALFASGTVVDAVSLCTPPQGRRAQAAAALAAGKHVMLEKPPGATLAEVATLEEAAGSLTLFATWHSRFAAAVEPARALLAGRTVHAARIDWREDVRVWHPGQRWVWEPGGLGVFDPGINALSILTAILPRPVFVTAAELDVPSDCQTPIAARLDLEDDRGAPVRAEFDWLQTGPQTWTITVETDGGTVTLEGGGRRLLEGGRVLAEGTDREYPGLYARFVELVRAGRSEVDLRPMRLVADAFTLARRRAVPPFGG